TPDLFRGLSAHTHVISAELACSPCLNAFNNRMTTCADNQCMKRISVDAVLEKATEIIGNRRRVTADSPTPQSARWRAPGPAWEGDLRHGKTCLCIESVPRWLRRPHEAGATRARGLSSLHRAGSWPDGHDLWSPHVRDHAVLGRRSS